MVAPLIAVAVAVLAGLAGWQLKSVLDAGQNHQAGSPPVTSTLPGAPSSSPTAGMVLVAANTLVGQNVRDVQHQLRKLGLQPKLVWQPPTGQQQPNTVISVMPNGNVQPGAVITVTVAGWCGGGGGDGGGDGGCGHDHGHGNGNGNGGN